MWAEQTDGRGFFEVPLRTATNLGNTDAVGLLGIFVKFCHSFSTLKHEFSDTILATPCCRFSTRSDCGEDGTFANIEVDQDYVLPTQSDADDCRGFSSGSCNPSLGPG